MPHIYYFGILTLHNEDHPSVVEANRRLRKKQEKFLRSLISRRFIVCEKSFRFQLSSPVYRCIVVPSGKHKKHKKNSRLQLSTFFFHRCSPQLEFVLRFCSHRNIKISFLHSLFYHLQSLANEKKILSLYVSGGKGNWG